MKKTLIGLLLIGLFLQPLTTSIISHAETIKPSLLDVKDSNPKRKITSKNTPLETKKALLKTINLRSFVSNQKSHLNLFATEKTNPLAKANTPPMILATDQEINQYEKYDPRDKRWGIQIYDKEDGWLDPYYDLNVPANDVDTSKPGIYDVMYAAGDSQGLYGTKWVKVTVKAVNTKPVINATNREIIQGATFNPLTGVTATDKEDGDLTSKIKVTRNTVNTSTPGVYDVTYSVTDSGGLTTTKDIKVTVNARPNTSPVINATNREMTQGTTFNPLTGVTATDNEDGDLTSKIKVTRNTVNTSTPGVYDVTYSVTDSGGLTTTKSIKVTVNPPAHVPPTISAPYAVLQLMNAPFDPDPKKHGVTAKDERGNDLTNRIRVIENTVDVTVEDTYYVNYAVTDANGLTSTKYMQVLVFEKIGEVPVIHAADKVITQNSSFDPLEGVTATDKEDGDLTNKIKVTKNTVDTSKPGTYEVRYAVEDSNQNIGTKAITVKVEAPGELSFKQVPDTLAFEQSEISGNTKFISRQDPNWAIQINNSIGGNWQVKASSTPIQDGNHREYPNTLIFKKANGKENDLAAGQQMIASGDSSNTSPTISWSKAEGILFRLNPQSILAGTYRATITWTLESTP